MARAGSIEDVFRSTQNGEEQASFFCNNVNQYLPNGRTDLMMAAERGDSNEVNNLISAGADVNAEDDSRRTALMNAAEKGHANIVDILSDCGAELNRKDENGRTALMLAAEGGHSEAVDILIKYKADVHVQSASDLETALTLIRKEQIGNHPEEGRMKVFQTIRKKLLTSGSCDMRRITSPITR